MYVLRKITVAMDLYVGVDIIGVKQCEVMQYRVKLRGSAQVLNVCLRACDTYPRLEMRRDASGSSGTMLETRGEILGINAARRITPLAVFFSAAHRK